MKKLLSLFAVLALGIAPLACDFGEDDGDAIEEYDIAEGDEYTPPDEDVVLEGECTEGQSAGLFYVRILDNEDNATLTDCNTNPGADVDGVVLVRPDGTEYYAATVEEDTDVVGGVCPQNDKSDINTVLGEPDGCVKELGCGCGDFGYPMNPDCECSRWQLRWLLQPQRRRHHRLLRGRRGDPLRRPDRGLRNVEPRCGRLRRSLPGGLRRRERQLDRPGRLRHWRGHRGRHLGVVVIPPLPA